MTSTNDGAAGKDLATAAAVAGGVPPAGEQGISATEHGIPATNYGVPTTDHGSPTVGAAPAAQQDVTSVQVGLPNIEAVVATEVVAAADQGVPAADLSDEDLEHQGAQTHQTRNWVFLHGTAEQFRTHTARMLELEQEYLRRHPKRTWQGTEAGQPGDERALLTRFAAIPDGRMHKLEAHHAARELGLRPERVAALHRQDPPLLTTQGDYRVLTDAGRAWLANQA